MNVTDELVRLIRENNALIKDNNRMLKEIINFINVYLSNATSENQRDFEQNVIANLISSIIVGK